MPSSKPAGEVREHAAEAHPLLPAEVVPVRQPVARPLAEPALVLVVKCCLQVSGRQHHAIAMVDDVCGGLRDGVVCQGFTRVHLQPAPPAGSDEGILSSCLHILVYT